MTRGHCEPSRGNVWGALPAGTVRAEFRLGCVVCCGHTKAHSMGATLDRATEVPGKFGLSWNPAFSPPLSLRIRFGFSWIFLDSLVRNEEFQWVTSEFRVRKYYGRGQ